MTLQRASVPLAGSTLEDDRNEPGEQLKDPSNGAPVFGLVEATDALVRETVGRARQAASEWGAMPMAARGGHLAEAGRCVASDREIAQLIVTDVGKPISEARAEQVRTSQIFEYYAGLSRGPVGELYEDAAGETVRVVRHPRGTAVLITPWNFPLAIPAWKLAPALLAGNGVILKPAPAATRVAARLVAAMHHAGIPTDACLMVAGHARPAQALLKARPDVVSFTGSLAVGQQVAATAGELRILCQLEMGGKNAVYVSSGADPDEAATIVLTGGMSYAGQKCTATSRVLVHVSRAAELSEALSHQSAELAVGDPRRESTVVGPMISMSERDRALNQLEAAVARGVQIDVGGSGTEGPGAYLAPTLVSGGERNDRMYREELFAPIVGVQPVTSFDQGLSEVNATPYGLVSGIVSPRRSEVECFVRKAVTGVVRINAPTTGLEPHIPFGGAKDSSLGPREQGRAGLEFFSETHTVYG